MTESIYAKNFARKNHTFFAKSSVSIQNDTKLPIKIATVNFRVSHKRITANKIKIFCNSSYDLSLSLFIAHFTERVARAATRD